MTFALLRFPLVLVIIKHMGKAISVLKQIKIKSNYYADLVVLENGWYKVRKYKVATYKKYKVNKIHQIVNLNWFYLKIDKKSMKI